MDWTGTCESVRINSNRLSHHQRTLASEHLPLAGTWPDINHSCALTTAARVCRHCVKHTSPHTHTHTHTHGTAPQSVWDRQTDRRTDASQHCLMPPIGGGTTRLTRNSAIAEGPRDASCRLKSCQLPRNSAETTCTTSPEPSIGCR